MPKAALQVEPPTDEQPESVPSRLDWRDAVGALGLASLVVGAWQVYSPAAWLVFGAALLLVAWRA